MVVMKNLNGVFVPDDLLYGSPGTQEAPDSSATQLETSTLSSSKSTQEASTQIVTSGPSPGKLRIGF